MKKEKSKKEHKLSFAEEVAEKSLKDRRIIEKNFKNIIDLYSSQRMQEIFKKLTESQKIISKISCSIPRLENEELIDAESMMPNSEKKITYIIEKVIKENFDKFLKQTDLDSCIKNKIAHCRFCGTPIMRIEDLSHFIKATIRCPNNNCKKVVRIPEDLHFKEKNGIRKVS